MAENSNTRVWTVRVYVRGREEPFTHEVVGSRHRCGPGWLGWKTTGGQIVSYCESSIDAILTTSGTLYGGE